MSEQPDQTEYEALIHQAEYPPEAFDFVQQGLGFTVEMAHGKTTECEKKLYQRMAQEKLDFAKLCEAYESGLLDDDLADLVDRLGGLAKINRHVTGEQLCRGLRELALKRWGVMAPSVLRKWGITGTVDFGKIVFFLVEHDFLQKQPHDSIEDFIDVYDFQSAFEPDAVFSAHRTP